MSIFVTPKASDIYPRGLEQQTFVEVPGISYMICGASRPGHFRGVDTARDTDGLALSSRNGYLSAEQRKLAPNLYRVMMEIADHIELGRRDFSKLIQIYTEELNSLGFKTDYIDIRCADTLLPPGHEDANLVILIAAFLGKTRLIDNVCVSLQSG